MQPNQKLKANDGLEVALFPCQTLYMSPDRDPDEHDVLALDFLPYNLNGQRITAMPCYAPVSGTIVYTGNDHNCILESDYKVHIFNEVGYLRVLVAHSFTAPVLNTHYNQGDLFYRTGNYGQSQGEHLHMEVALVQDKSEQYWNTGGIGLYKAIHMWNGLFINNTLMLRPEDYDWKKYEGYVSLAWEHHFKWVLYAKKLREKRLGLIYNLFKRR